MSAGVHPPAPRPAILSAVQAPVRAELDAVSRMLRQMVVGEFPVIEEVAGHVLAMRGKMIRPTLVLLSSALGGGAAPRAIALGAIVELVHLATLVHDDAVDHSALRRGMPTVNARFSHQVSVIMGDFLYSRAMVELVRDGDLDVLRATARATTQMTIGEMRQLRAVDALAFSERDYEMLIAAKTASLFSAACEVGASVGAPAWRDALARFGDRLGMTFQVVDDLLDYTAEARVTGKPGGLDLREHKMTLPLIAALREASAPERREVERLFTSPEPTAGQVSDVIGMVAARGGLSYARAVAERYAEEAAVALEGAPGGAATDALHRAVGYALDRDR